MTSDPHMHAHLHIHVNMDTCIYIYTCAHKHAVCIAHTWGGGKREIHSVFAITGILPCMSLLEGQGRASELPKPMITE